MNKAAILSLVLSSGFILTASAELKLQAVTDRPDALYKVGEEVTFTITATDDDEPLSEGTVKVAFSKNGVHPQPPQELPLKEGKATINGKLDEPGFLSLNVRSGQATAMAAAGFEPEKLKPSMPVPSDFDAFWEARKAKLAKVPMHPRLTAKIDNEAINSANLELFDVQLDSVGAPVSGYYIRPKNAAKRSLPAILTLHGAGVSSSLISPRWGTCEGGMISLDINAHGLPNGKPAEYYHNLAKGELLNYWTRGRQDREQIYFLNMFLRIIRAIDFLTAQPEWDGKTLILYGTSQGGFQAFAGAALDPRVTFFCAGVPAGCDHTGYAADRVAGWPKLVAMAPHGTPDPVSMEAARYFDNVNFATRIKARGGAVTVGFLDPHCPPSSVYAAYNALTVPKKIHIDPLADHNQSRDAVKFMESAVRDHVRTMKNAN